MLLISVGSRIRIRVKLIRLRNTGMLWFVIVRFDTMCVNIELLVNKQPWRLIHPTSQGQTKYSKVVSNQIFKGRLWPNIQRSSITNNYPSGNHRQYHFVHNCVCFSSVHSEKTISFENSVIPNQNMRSYSHLFLKFSVFSATRSSKSQ